MLSDSVSPNIDLTMFIVTCLQITSLSVRDRQRTRCKGDVAPSEYAWLQVDFNIPV